MRIAVGFHFPHPSELLTAYNRFLLQESIDESFFVSTSQWVRVDPRLGEIWCSTFLKEFSRLNPAHFKKLMETVPFPQVIGVLIEQSIRHYVRASPVRRDLRNFLRYVMDGLAPVAYQDFFIGLAPLGANSVRAAAEIPGTEFAKYGFYGNTVFRTHGSGRDSTSLRAKARKPLLEKFLKSQTSQFTVDDYLKSLPVGASRRVAQMDLAAHPRVQPWGNTRSRIYRVARS